MLIEQREKLFGKYLTLQRLFNLKLTLEKPLSKKRNSVTRLSSLSAPALSTMHKKVLYYFISKRVLINMENILNLHLLCGQIHPSQSTRKQENVVILLRWNCPPVTSSLTFQGQPISKIISSFESPHMVFYLSVCLIQTMCLK